MVEEKNPLEEGDVSFDVNEWENKPENNLLAKGRYKFKVLDVEARVANSGNNCVVVKLLVEKKRITDWLIRSDSEGKKHQMGFKWHNFLYAIGIRNTNSKFSVNKSQIVGAEGLCDVKVNKEGTDNAIDNYSPIESPTAGMSDVPPDTSEPEKEEKGKEKKETKKDKDKEPKPAEGNVEDL